MLDMYLLESSYKIRRFEIKKILDFERRRSKTFFSTKDDANIIKLSLCSNEVHFHDDLPFLKYNISSKDDQWSVTDIFFVVYVIA